MDKQNCHGAPPSAQNPPLNSEEQPYQQVTPAVGPPNTPILLKYQLNDAPCGVVSTQGTIVEPPQHIIFVHPIQPTHEPDYLAFSILTMLFCCPVLGIAASVYSCMTRCANRYGNGTEAQRYSKVAKNLAISALGVGIVFTTVGITVVVWYYSESIFGPFPRAT